MSLRRLAGRGAGLRPAVGSALDLSFDLVKVRLGTGLSANCVLHSEPTPDRP